MQRVITEKTFEEWNESGLALTEFLSVGDTVDSGMVEYFIEVMPPLVMTETTVQMGFIFSCDKQGRGLYPTIENYNGEWVFTGLKSDQDR